MKKVALVIFQLSAILLAVEGTINVCVPLNSVNSQDEISTNTLLEEIKTDIKAKFSDNNHVIDVGHIDLDLTHPAIRVNGTLDNVLLSNLFEYNMCLLDIDLATTKFTVFNLTFNHIKVKGNYDITGNIGDLFDIFGTGDFWIKMMNFSIAMTHFNLSIGEEICFPINIDMDLVGMKNNFKGLMNDAELEELFNDAIKAIAPECLAIIWSEIKDIFDGPLEKAINDYLHNQNVVQAMSRIVIGADNITLPYCFTNDDIINLESNIIV